MNTSPPPESSSRSAAAPTRTTPGTIVIGSTCWAVMTPMIADPQTPRPSCVYYCTLRTPTPAIQHTKMHVKALDARLGALPCQESWGREEVVRVGQFIGVGEERPVGRIAGEHLRAQVEDVGGVPGGEALAELLHQVRGDVHGGLGTRIL